MSHEAKKLVETLSQRLKQPPGTDRDAGADASAPRYPYEPPHRTAHAHPRPRWLRVVIVLAATVAVIPFLILAPELIVPMLLLALILLFWERMQIMRIIRNLTTHIEAGDPGTKLEVPDGAPGQLCHAVNGLLQQQRLQQHANTFLPTLSTRAVQSLLDHSLPPQGLPCTLSVLVIGYTRGATESTPPLHDQIHILRQLALTVQQQAEYYNALFEHSGNLLVLTFGSFEASSTSRSLRNALQVAHTLRRMWETLSPHGKLTLSLASGIGLAVVMPGLGYTVLGEPVEQALQIGSLAASHPEYPLLCSEEAYLTLRRIDAAAWHATDLRLIQPGRPTRSVYAGVGAPADEQ